MRKTALALIATVLTIGLAAFGASTSASKSSYDPPALVTVKYEAFQEVKGIVTRAPKNYYEKQQQHISVTVSTPTGIEQHDFIGSIKNKNGGEFVAYKFQRGNPVSISVQNTGNRGFVTCRISVDDVVVSENVSSGQYGIASCSGLAR